MRTHLFLAALLLTPVLAQTAPTPSSKLDGDWQLTGLSERGPQNLNLLRPAGQIRIQNGQVTGNYGCGRFAGSIQADAGSVQVSVQLLPQRVRCLIAVRGNLTGDLNAAQHYLQSGDSLLLFSDSARLLFTRVQSPVNEGSASFSLWPGMKGD